MNPVMIAALVEAAVELTKLIPQVVKDLKRTGELTPEQEAALDAKIAELPTKEHWQIED